MHLKLALVLYDQYVRIIGRNLFLFYLVYTILENVLIEHLYFYFFP